MFSPACTLSDVKTIAPGQMYSESSSETHSAVVAKRQGKISRDYHNAARELDQRLGITSGEIGVVLKSSTSTTREKSSVWSLVRWQQREEEERERGEVGRRIALSNEVNQHHTTVAGDDCACAHTEVS